MKIKRMYPCHTCNGTGLVSLSDPDAQTVGKRHRKAHETEKAAAYAVMPRAGLQRRKVLDVIGESGEGICDVRGSVESGVYHQSYLARRNELREGGWVEPSGLTEETGNGGIGIRWRLTPHGRQEWEEARHAT